MNQSPSRVYKESLWELYARAISLFTILGVIGAGIIGGYDLVELVFPHHTLNASLHEKYQSNEAYTKFGVLKQDLSSEQVTQQRVANYNKVLRIERRNAKQSLIKVVLGLLVIAILNGVLTFTWPLRKRRE